MRSLLIGLVSSIVCLICVYPAFAADPCASPEACVEVLAERPSVSSNENYIKNKERLERARSRIGQMDPEAVALAFGDAFTRKTDRLQNTDRWNIATLSDRTRRALAFNLLRRDTDAQLLQAGQVMRWEDADAINARLATLPDTKATPIRDRIHRLSHIRTKRGPASLALLLSEPERSNALAHQLSRAYSSDAANALQYLNRIDPARADQLTLPIFASVGRPDKLVEHLSGSGFMEEKNYRWLATLWTDRRQPDRVRSAALDYTLDSDNTSPPPWTPQLAEAVETHDMRTHRWSDVLALYGNDALDVFVRRYAERPEERAALLESAARVEGLDASRLEPLVRQGLAGRDDYEVTVGALKVWRYHGLRDLDAQAQAAVNAVPFDFVHQAAFGPQPQRNAPYIRPSDGMTKIRAGTDYCERGAPIGNADTAREQARIVGVPVHAETPYGISLQAVTAARRFGDGWYVGYHRGEFGGGLLRYGANGQSETVFNENVRFIAPMNPEEQESETLWVMAGLNHMFARGSLHQIGPSGVRHVMRLPSEVKRLAVEGDAYMLSFHDPERNTDQWLYYHPPLKLFPDGRLERACP